MQLLFNHSKIQENHLLNLRKSIAPELCPLYFLIENSKYHHSFFIWDMLHSKPSVQFNVTTLSCSSQLCEHKAYIMIYAKHFPQCKLISSLFLPVDLNVVMQDIAPVVISDQKIIPERQYSNLNGIYFSVGMAIQHSPKIYYFQIEIESKVTI